MTNDMTKATITIGGKEHDVTDHFAKIGHNSNAFVNSEAAATGGIAADRLRSIVERIERLTSEREGLNSDIKDILTESKSSGFDVKTIKQILRLRKMDPAKAEEEQQLLDIYMRALGM